MSAEQPIPASRIPPHGVDEDTDYGQNPTVESGGNRLVRSTVERFGEYSGWERQECNQHQVEDVKQQKHSIHADDMFEHGVVVDPDCADHQEADHVGEVGRPKLEEFCPKRRTGWRHFDTSGSLVHHRCAMWSGCEKLLGRRLVQYDLLKTP